MQQSIEGLLRSMLHSVLLSLSQSEISSNVETIKQICGPRWQSGSANGAWNRKELEQMLIRLSSVPKVKSFFLIDALDECEPQDRHDDLADQILWMSQLPNVKLCVSCRPWEVFTRKFTSGVSLRLEHLTRRDMESYVEARLTATEEEKGWNSEFRSKTQTARQLIQSVARDAEGVFLWTELVVKAMCSEMRKGRRVEQLSQIVSEFPTDLDDYFHRLIFDRIGRSRQNVADTAAALRLALIIRESTETKDTAFPRSHPFPDSFMNFWLLSNDHLGPDFSWMDNEHIYLPPNSQMLDQTASYLEETCKDLLVLRDLGEVDFLHRTVFDFLSGKQVYDVLKQNAPSHFASNDFTFNLAKLRCVCLLRGEHRDHVCLVEKLDEVLGKYQHLTHLDQHFTWLLKCESATVSHLRENHPWRGQVPCRHQRDGFERRCAKARLSRCILELYRHAPYIYIMTVNSRSELDLLGEILLANIQPEIREPDKELLRSILEIGCDPNSALGEWPWRWVQRYPFCTTQEEEQHKEDFGSLSHRCATTNWTAWLREAYIRLRGDSKTVSGSDDTIVLRKQRIGAAVDLLLRYGADPHCMVCISDSWGAKSVVDCELIALDRLMDLIVPMESLKSLLDLRDLCSSRVMAYELRRNQRRRAVRSLLITAQNLDLRPRATDPWLHLPDYHQHVITTPDLTYIARLKFAVCSNCPAHGRFQKFRLGVWCLDCGGLSSLCSRCLRLNASGLPTLQYSCVVDTSDHAAPFADHTLVTLVWEDGGSGLRSHYPADADFVDLLHSLYNPAKTINVMREWYTKDPIEPNLSFEDAIRGLDVPSSYPGLQQTGGHSSVKRKREPTPT